MVTVGRRLSEMSVPFTLAVSSTKMSRIFVLNRILFARLQSWVRVFDVRGEENKTVKSPFSGFFSTF